MIGRLAPGETFEAWTPAGFSTGATVGARIRTAAGADFLARTVVGVTEDPAGSGIYKRSFTAPTTAGDYSLVWDDATIFRSESFQVAYSAASLSAASGRDLCSLTDVVELVPGYSAGDDTATDSLLQDLLTAESRDAMENTGREFSPIAGRNPRSFDVDVTVARLRRCQIGDLAFVNGITIVNAQGALVQTVDLDGVVLEPRVREDWQPVGTLWFRWDATTPANLFFGNVVVVDAVWGFPQIPDTVRKAVARLTIVRYLNDAVSQGTKFSEAADRAEFNIAASIRWSLNVLDRFYVPLFQSTGDWNTGNLPTGVAGVDW